MVTNCGFSQHKNERERSKYKWWWTQSAAENCQGKIFSLPSTKRAPIPYHHDVTSHNELKMFHKMRSFQKSGAKSFCAPQILKFLLLVNKRVVQPTSIAYAYGKKGQIMWIMSFSSPTQASALSLGIHSVLELKFYKLHINWKALEEKPWNEIFMFLSPTPTLPSNSSVKLTQRERAEHSLTLSSANSN